MTDLYCYYCINYHHYRSANYSYYHYKQLAIYLCQIHLCYNQYCYHKNQPCLKKRLKLASNKYLSLNALTPSIASSPR